MSERTKSEEEIRELSGKMYAPSDPDLLALKRHAHVLSQRFNMTTEDQQEERTQMLKELFLRRIRRSFLPMSRLHLWTRLPQNPLWMISSGSIRMITLQFF